MGAFFMCSNSGTWGLFSPCIVTRVPLLLSRGEGEGLAAAPLAQQVYLPHDLHCPLEVQALLDDPSEHLFGLGLRPMQEEGLLDVVRVLNTCEFRDTCGTHLLLWK